MLNARLEQLREQIKKRGGSFNTETNFMARDLAMYRACREPQRSLAQLRARTLLEFMSLFPARIDGDWQIAGEHPQNHLSLATWYGSLSEGRSNDECRKALRELDPEVDFDLLKRTIEPRLRQRNSCLSAGEPTASARAGSCCWELLEPPDHSAVYMANGWIENHSVRGYARLLRLGYGGLRREVEAELARYPLHSVEYAERENFLRAALAVCDAGILLGRRYAEAAEQAARNEPDPERRKRLEQMAAICRRVPEHGAATYREAVQSLWFGHLLTCCEDTINANSLGRVDQMLDPYYQADLAAGRINRAEALELQIELALRLYLDYDVQAITLGGVDAEGRCAVNETSMLMLEATEAFGEIRDLSVRVTPDTPEEFLRYCARLVLRGGGIPFFFNDDCFIPALHARGVALEDARDYAPIGCIELTIPGKANSHAVSGWFNLLKVLELTLYGGVNPASGEQLGLDTGDPAEFADYAELEEAFFRQMEHFASIMIYRVRRGEIEQRNFGALPVWSVLTEDCIARGRDITNFGARYNFHDICLMGVPDCADCLCALRKLVFEEKAVSFAELRNAMRDNFSGHETLRAMLLQRAPKYGNAVDEVDLLGANAAKRFIALMDKWSRPDNRIFVHLFTFFLNLPFGRQVGAMPDGRLAGSPLAYSLSAHQGRDCNGVTALLHSLSHMPHRDAAGGSAAIIDLHPSFFSRMSKEKSEELFVQLLRGAFASGVGQTQWNMLSVEQLEQAKRDPEHYGNIPVRVAGYSQMFKLLEPRLQDHIIARNKHQN